MPSLSASPSLPVRARAPRVGTARPLAAPDPAATAGRELAPLRMRRYLPLAVLTTALVTVLPALVTTAVLPRGSTLLLAASGLSAVALSIAIATVGAALWKRWPGSRDVIFADLLLWGWLRRCWTERRLSQAQRVYDAAKRAGPTVDIELLTGLSRLLEARDAYTHGHGQRVARHAARIARTMHLPSAEVAKIRAAAAVHDVGKIYTPREILNNPERLSSEEFAVLKRHPVEGADMLAAVGDPELVAMVRHHHERIDGEGYPDRLRGQEIPIGARIIAVADTFDAITCDRAYRTAGSQKRALDVLSQTAGSQLDGDAVAAFRGGYGARRSVAWLALAAVVPERILAGLQTGLSGFGPSAAALTSLVPALGAAGLLGVSGAVHRGVPIAGHAQRPAALTELHRPALGAAPTHPASHRVTRRTAAAGPSEPVHRHGHSKPTAPVRPTSSIRTRTPSAAAPRTAEGAPGPAGELPTIGSTPPIPPTTGPQLKEVPTPPAPPTGPPVTLPQVPGVTPPTVQVPSVPVALPALP
jgi:hypothetical protein